MLEFFGFIWDIIQSILDMIVNVVDFLKNLVVTIPGIVSYFPSEISNILMFVFPIIIGMFIYKLVK